MIRHYCDRCGEELTMPGDLAHDKWFQIDSGHTNGNPRPKIRVRTIVDVDGVSNAGVVCTDCVKRVVADGYFGRDSAAAPVDAPGGVS